MTHIVCRHYVHMTNIKFLQEIDQIIITGCDLVVLIYLDKYQLGFTLSCVRASGSRTLHIFQGLSCLWRYNDARMIIFLAWYHNFFHGICASLGATCSNRMFWSNKCNRLSWDKFLFFSSSFFEIIHTLGVVIWIRNSYCSLKTSIQVGKYQQLEFVTFIASFSHSSVCGSKWKKYFFSFEEKISTFYVFHS